MNKSIIISTILLLGSMVMGCSNEHLESNDELIDSYISLINTNIIDLDILKIKEDLKEYDFERDSYFIENMNNERTNEVEIYSFKDNPDQIDIEIGSDKYISLNYLSNNSKSLVKKISIHKYDDVEKNVLQAYFNSIKDRNKFIDELNDTNTKLDNYILYREIENYIHNNNNASFDDIQSMCNIEFKSHKLKEGLNEYTYGKKDDIKLMYDDNLRKFLRIEYNYNGYKLYYARLNELNSQNINNEIGIMVDGKSIDLSNTLSKIDF